MPEVTSPAQPVVAAFDFDGTLTRSDTLLPFLRRLLGSPTLLWVLFVCSPWLAGYVLRFISNHRAKAVLLKAALADRTVAEVERCAQAFVRDVLPQQWRPWGLQQLVQHQQAGHRCVLVTASTSPYMHLVGASLSVDAVLCTEMEVVDSRYTGRMVTANCHGEEKVRRLQAWLAAEYGTAQPELNAYGDTKGDLPMLRLAQQAWYREKPWKAS
ncbi:HAD family hydrolase [Curvibacter delicatus]|jgi:phosphatidylglycerophosphatase C|uniref:HAD family hydrolase n=1 Tax=Curvibacter delicatus TaxID=80879 RepID=UPI000834B0D8|nr:HAD family hydrolase [Curvibacter delicatus]